MGRFFLDQQQGHHHPRPDVTVVLTLVLTLCILIICLECSKKIYNFFYFLFAYECKGLDTAINKVYIRDTLTRE